jgi:hypothetical protein
MLCHIRLDIVRFGFFRLEYVGTSSIATVWNIFAVIFCLHTL